MMPAMKIVLGVLTAVGLMSAALAGQSADTPEAHVALARTAAGDTYQNLFNFLCAAPAPRGGNAGQARGGGGAPGTPAPARPAPAVPDRSTWHAEPLKVFDNLYWVGQTEYSAWAVKTSAGIILLDTLFDYSVEDEVVGGLEKLGLTPSSITYSVVTHPHPDHHGGARFLQDTYRTRIVMSEPDWEVIERLSGTKPVRDMVAIDGQKLTLGDTTITLYVTPGHTPGTLSMIFTVRDNSTSHTVAYWGGNGLNNDRASLEQYIQSATRFAEIARRANADILMSNHTDWDGSKVYFPKLANRTAASPNPYVVGSQGVARYLTVARECATAKLMRLGPPSTSGTETKK
jgi:metallo-beta-lactamase class B